MVNGIFWLISNEDGGGKLKTWFCENAPIFLFNTYVQSTLYYSASVTESAISLLNLKEILNTSFDQTTLDGYFFYHYSFITLYLRLYNFYQDFMFSEAISSVSFPFKLNSFIVQNPFC